MVWFFSVGRQPKYGLWSWAIYYWERTRVICQISFKTAFRFSLLNEIPNSSWLRQWKKIGVYECVNDLMTSCTTWQRNWKCWGKAQHMQSLISPLLLQSFSDGYLQHMGRDISELYKLTVNVDFISGNKQWNDTEPSLYLWWLEKRPAFHATWANWAAVEVDKKHGETDHKVGGEDSEDIPKKDITPSLRRIHKNELKHLHYHFLLYWLTSRLYRSSLLLRNYKEKQLST